MKDPDPDGQESPAEEADDQPLDDVADDVVEDGVEDVVEDDAAAPSAEIEIANEAGEIERIDPEGLPLTRLAAAAPSAPARGLAFGSIVIGGVCGGLIGFAFTDLQCDDGCTAWAGLSGIVGAIVGAVGVAIVAVLVLRAMDEWESVKDEQPENHPARRRSGR